MRCENGKLYITEPTSICPMVNFVQFTDAEGMRCSIELETLLRLVDCHKADMLHRKIEYKDLVKRTIEQCKNRLLNKDIKEKCNGVG
jgi:hypothetical protein